MSRQELESDPEYASLTAQLRRGGVECSHYKDRCVQRRIRVRMRARGVAGYADYERLLEQDPSEYERLAQALTINVSRFFRNWPVYAAIAETVVPALWERTSGPIRIWSAGCAAGEEAYSLAALFHDYALQRGEASLAGRIHVLGSDVDESVLAHAGRGVYPESALSETPAAFRERYFERVGRRQAVGAELRGLVRFERRDLLLGEEAADSYDLILCRNVIIYFERPAQQAIVERLYRALSPGGFLVLGRVEAVFGALRRALRPADLRERIYQRTAADSG